MSVSQSTLQMQMQRRFMALMRKVKVKETEPHAINLMKVLTKHVITKRDYEEVLSSEEAAEAFCQKHELHGAEEQLLMSLQAQKDIFTPIPILDWVLTTMFLAQVASVGWVLWSRGLTFPSIILFLLIDAVVHRVQSLSYSLGRRMSSWLRARGATDTDALAGRIQMKKWQEQSWQLFVHTAAALMGGVILTEENWWRNPAECWIPHPYEQVGRERTDLHVFYMAQLGVWIYTCFMHRFMDERRKDYYVMYTHHVVTIALVGVSWVHGYLRIGLLVLYVHDVSDIFVDLLKMTNYLKLEGPRGFFGTELAYVSCVAGWMYWRLYQYPFRVLVGSFLEPLRLLTKHPRPRIPVFGMDVAPIADWFGLDVFPPDLPLYTEMNVLLFTLLALHIYWFHLFVMIGYRILTESTREASRQEYEGDSDEEDSADSSAASGAKGAAARQALASPARRGSSKAAGAVGSGEEEDESPASEPGVASPPGAAATAAARSRKKKGNNSS